jgi:FlaA1/EpsC-like NDP-sugar epimerase
LIFSRNEILQWKLKQKYKNLEFRIGDIRNHTSVRDVIHDFRPSIVIIASALKHIDICEDNIEEACLTNIIGINNIFRECCKVNFLKEVLLVSTDKACSPINVYGMSKSIGEKMAVNYAKKNSNISFKVVRYGNVISSNGSLFQVYNNIANDPSQQYFPVTDTRMTRFLMTLDQSIDLIENTLLHGESGCIHVPHIKSYKIIDIALFYSKKYNKPIQITGIRQNEKLHEELINQTEFLKSINCGYFIQITNNITKVSDPTCLQIPKSYSSIDVSEIFNGHGEYIFKEYLPKN